MALLLRFCAGASVVLSLMACGDNSTSAGGSVPVPDAGTPPAVDMAVPPYSPPFPPVAPQVLKAASTVLASPKVVPVFFPQDALQSTLVTFLQNYQAKSAAWGMLSEYGIGRGTTAAPVTLPTTLPATFAEADVQALLAARIGDGTLPRPDANTIYALYFPSTVSLLQGGSTSCIDFAGYHGTSTLTDGTKTVYAVMPRCQMGLLALLTYATSHELAEAATDPHLLGYNSMSDPYFLWTVGHSGAEVSDLCQDLVDAAVNEAGVGVVCRNWSNKAAAQYTNPCLPAAAGPSFFSIPRHPQLNTVLINGQAKNIEVVPLLVGQTVSVEVRGLSDVKPGPSWTVKAEELPLPGSSGGMATKVLTFAWQEAPGKALAPLKDGASVHLLLSTPSTSPTGYTTFRLTSSGLTTAGKTTETQWVGTVYVGR